MNLMSAVRRLKAERKLAVSAAKPFAGSFSENAGCIHSDGLASGPVWDVE